MIIKNNAENANGEITEADKISRTQTKKLCLLVALIIVIIAFIVVMIVLYT